MAKELFLGPMVINILEIIKIIDVMVRANIYFQTKENTLASGKKIKKMDREL